MTTVSVALATYNGASHISEQILSILAQTVPVFEIVLADDGSTDDTVAIVRRCIAQAGPAAPTLIVLPVDGNRGVVANFERAIAACSGEFIALCDQDDVWHPDRVAGGLAALTGRSSLLFDHGDADLVDADGAALGTSLFEALAVGDDDRAAISNGDAFSTYIRRNIATGATAMFRTRLVQLAAPFPRSWVHDEWLAIIAAAHEEIAVLDVQLIDYRQHGANQIGVKKATFTYRVQRMLQPRADRYTILAERAAVLVERLAALDVGDEVRQLAEAKLRFEQVRSSYPRNRLARLPLVLREWRAGSYHRLSSQRSADVLRDLLQPA